MVKRDLNMIRELLVILENNDGNSELSLPQDWNREVVAYQIEILSQAGYVKDQTRWADGGPYWIHASLTWHGHEFLDAIRNDTVWAKTKENVKKQGFEIGSIPITILKDIATIQIKSYFGIN